MSSSLTEVGRPGRDQFVFICDTVTMDWTGTDQCSPKHTSLRSPWRHTNTRTDCSSTAAELILLSLAAVSGQLTAVCCCASICTKRVKSRENSIFGLFFIPFTSAILVLVQQRTLLLLILITLKIFRVLKIISFSKNICFVCIYAC